MAVTYICGCSAHERMPGIVAALPHCTQEEWSRCWFGSESEFDVNPLISFKCIMIHYLRQDPISGAWKKLCERQAEVVWSKLCPRQRESASQPTTAGFCKGRQHRFECWNWLEGSLDVLHFSPNIFPPQLISHVSPTQQGITKGQIQFRFHLHLQSLHHLHWRLPKCGRWVFSY